MNLLRRTTSPSNSSIYETSQVEGPINREEITIEDFNKFIENWNIPKVKYYHIYKSQNINISKIIVYNLYRRKRCTLTTSYTSL